MNRITASQDTPHTAPGTILVRRPGPLLPDGLVFHGSRQRVDLARASDQWTAYVDAFRSTGWQVSEVDPADDCADAVFIEDALVVFGDVIVVTRPGAAARQPEISGARAAAGTTGLTVFDITAPATLDGGDILKVGSTVYVGLSARTNHHALDQLTAMLTPRGWTVRGVPVSKVLHLKSGVTALPDGRMLMWLDGVDEPDQFVPGIAMPEEPGAHVVDLGGGNVMMATGCPTSVALITSFGYRVVTVDISEFVKLDGCVTCLSVRIRPADGTDRSAS